MWRHGRQPTRLPRPWDSPGKSTGVGCHFLLQCMKVKSESEVAQSCLTLSNPMDCSPPGSELCPWDFPGKSTGVGCHCLLCLRAIVPLKFLMWSKLICQLLIAFPFVCFASFWQSWSRNNNKSIIWNVDSFLQSFYNEFLICLKYLSMSFPVFSTSSIYC